MHLLHLYHCSGAYACHPVCFSVLSCLGCELSQRSRVTYWCHFTCGIFHHAPHFKWITSCHTCSINPWYKCHLPCPVISSANKCIINLKGKKPSPCHPICFAAGHGEQILLYLKLRQFVLFDFSPHKLSTLVPLTQKRFATENKWQP